MTEEKKIEEIQKDDTQEVGAEKGGKESTAEEPKKDADYYKAEAEKLEAENKELKGGSKEDEIANNQKIRFEKAKAQNEQLKNKPEEKVKGKEITTDDAITLRLNKFAKDSDEAKVLKQFKEAGMINDYESGLEDVSVKARLEAIKADKEARAIVGENDGDNNNLITKKDAINNFRNSGVLPNDPDLKKEIALDTLERNGL